jgi:hypothetical protein
MFYFTDFILPISVYKFFYKNSCTKVNFMRTFAMSKSQKLVFHYEF